MILSRTKSDLAEPRNPLNLPTAKKASPELENFILKRDYTGARAYLEYTRSDTDKENILLNDEWIAFCSFHLGDYQRALELYEAIALTEPATYGISLNVAVCLFYLGRYEEAQHRIERVSNTPEKLRLIFHLAHKFDNEEHLKELHSLETSQETLEDQLSLASIHYMRAHYQDAIDIYRKLLLDNKDYLAINVYLALCYYKMDYYETSQDILNFYLIKHRDSTIAINLKACNRFRLFNGRVAEQEIRNIDESGSFGNDLIRHNISVFRNGEGAMQTFPALLDVVPEARLNLTIYYLKHGNVEEAHNLIKKLKPSAAHEYILKGVVYVALGQQLGLKEHLKTAQQNFHIVGSSATECDTIPGRQSMASAFFLYNQFEEVLVYMNSIRSYFVKDDTFNFNYAQAKCATGCFKDAEELLLNITNSDIKNQILYSMVLVKCQIYIGKPELAWNIFLTRDTSPEAFHLLQLIANECYKCGEFWVSAKAFDMLEKLDPSPENWEGKRGACMGALYASVCKVDKGRAPNGINDILVLLRESSNPQAEAITKVVKKYMNILK